MCKDVCSNPNAPCCGLAVTWFMVGRLGWGTTHQAGVEIDCKLKKALYILYIETYLCFSDLSSLVLFTADPLAAFAILTTSMALGSRMNL